MATEPKEPTMSDPEEAEDRTKRWRECCERDNHEDHEYWSDPQSQEDDEELLIDWALDRLASDRAEADERAKPIDQEWLRSIGGDFGGVYIRFDMPRQQYLAMSRIGPSFNVYLQSLKHNWSVWVCVMETRGQLLDLIRALKGGAT